MASHVHIGHNTAEAGATQINNVTNNISLTNEEINRACLAALRCPDSLKTKNRLKSTKDELLRDSFKWILSDEQYRRWRDGDDVSLLWIKGDAGKGKTMMAIGLTEELSHHMVKNTPVIYFFCQNADYELNTVEAVVKGLILQLVKQQQNLIQVLRKRWNTEKGHFLEDVDSLQTSWDIFLEMLEHCQSTYSKVFIVIDALDECQAQGKADILRMIIRTALSRPSQIKWLLTSRPLGEAEHHLMKSANRIHISFELNALRIAEGIRTYISHQVHQLAILQHYDASTQRAVEQAVLTRATGTFLWASLVCKRLESVSADKAVSTVNEFPPELERLYDQVYTNLCADHHSDRARHLQLLKALMLAYRPLNIPELISISVLTDNRADSKKLIDQCSSFIKSRSEGDVQYVEFVHQSAREYLFKHFELPSPYIETSFSHAEMAAKCLSHLTDNLHANLLQWSDTSGTRKELLKRGQEPLISLGYAAQFWTYHLQAATDTSAVWTAPIENGVIETFLRRRFLEWLECLSLIDQLPRAMRGLETLLIMLGRIEKSFDVSSLLAFTQDAYRFLKRFNWMILEWPLQVYTSAVFFSPEVSLVRRANLSRLSEWLQQIPSLETQWSSLQQTLQGHSDFVSSVAFSPDGQLIASGSMDDTVKVWETQTGQMRRTFEGHSDCVHLIAFSPDGQLIASGSLDKMVIVWEAQTGQVRQKFKGQSGRVISVAFSPDGQLISTSHWRTGPVRRRRIVSPNMVFSVAFSPDGQLVATGGTSNTVKIWETQTGQIRRTLKGHSGSVLSVAFSPDGQLIASGSVDKTVKIWETQTGQIRRTLKGHSGSVLSVAFSPDGQLIASGSGDKMVKIWEAQTGQTQKLREHHFNSIKSVKISSNNKTIVSRDESQSKIWDIQTRRVQQTKKIIGTGLDDLITNTMVRSRRYLIPKVDGLKRLQVRDQWLLYGSARILRFPLEFTATCYDENGDYVAIGFENGQVCYFNVNRKILDDA